MEEIKKAVALADKVRHVFVATADATGLPHVASAGRLTYAPDGRVVLADWFCPGTVTNLQQNPQIAIVAWDTATDVGYQLLGEVDRVKELGIMYGYVPGEEDKPPLPQVERELLVRVDKIIAFSHAPHSDVEE
ncbi:MAG: pyridoxamine 5'-phosphate oxidase family protein [Anaerolineae bacterium]